MKILYLIAVIILLSFDGFSQPPVPDVVWKYYSTEKGDMEVPNGSEQQTSCVVFDIDNDGINDFIVTERVKAPAVVWYKKTVKYGTGIF